MKKRSVFQTLIKNYVLFTAVLVFIVFLTIMLSAVFLTSSMQDEVMPKITAESLVKENYETIDMTDLEIAGGWIEIIDSQGDVIFVKGDKKTTFMNYTLADLADLVGYQEHQAYFYQSEAFLSTEDETLILLVVLPEDAVELNINITFGLFDTSNHIVITLILSVIVFILLFIGNVWVYTKWTAKKIKMPLEKISLGLKEVTEKQLETPMDFKAEYEFLEIRDAFNMMIEKLHQQALEKQEIEHLKNEMFVHISHDLKTPITTISGFSKALSEGMINDPVKVKNVLNTIYQKSQKLTQLVDDLFELSKLENAGYQLEMKDENIVEVVRLVVAEFYEQAEEKDIELAFNCDLERFMLKIDKKAIHRAISNLLSNAIHYNPKHTKVSVELKAIKSSVIIDVKDNGVGIDEHIRKHIFMPFYRGDTSRTSKEGSGLGLAITKKLVEKHGGDIVLTADEHDKTIFRITMNL